MWNLSWDWKILPESTIEPKIPLWVDDQWDKCCASLRYNIATWAVAYQCPMESRIHSQMHNYPCPSYIERNPQTIGTTVFWAPDQARASVIYYKILPLYLAFESMDSSWELQQLTYLNQSFDLLIRQLFLLPRFQKFRERRESDDLWFGGIHARTIVHNTRCGYRIKYLLFMKITTGLVLMRVDRIISR